MSYKSKCEICGKELIRDYPIRFCSLECRWKDEDYRNKMIEVGKKVNENPTEDQLKARFQKGHTINNGEHRSIETEFQCGPLHPNWKGGTEKYRGSDWDEQKSKALERDDFTCQRCGAKEDLNVHHVIPYKEKEDNSLDNLITLCRKCHIIHERGYSKLLIFGEDIAITNVPERTLEEFLEISNSSFNGETGMCLDHLIWSNKTLQNVYLPLKDLEERVSKLENNKDENKGKKMLDGTIIK